MTDGVVLTRPIRPFDVAALERFYAELEPETLHARFFALSHGISHTQATGFCDADHEHREGFVAIEHGPAGERIVGHLCLEPGDPGSATAADVEVGIAVEEDVQGRGIGRRLMLEGIDWARQHRLDHLSATMLTTNDAIRGLLTHLGVPATLEAGDPGELAVTIDLDEAVGAVDGPTLLPPRAA